MFAANLFCETYAEITVLNVKWSAETTLGFIIALSI